MRKNKKEELYDSIMESVAEVIENVFEEYGWTTSSTYDVFNEPEDEVETE